jgi:hypothetical protein
MKCEKTDQSAGREIRRAMARDAAGECRGESSFALQPSPVQRAAKQKRIPPGDAKADARRKTQHLVIPDLTRNPES